MTYLPHSLTGICASAVLASGLALASTQPANAQLSVDLGTKVEIGTERKDPPPPPPQTSYHFEYRNYRDGPPPHQERRYSRTYKAYDCYTDVHYDYERGERVRYEDTYCYDDRGKRKKYDTLRIVIKAN